MANSYLLNVSCLRRCRLEGKNFCWTTPDLAIFTVWWSMAWRTHALPEEISNNESSNPQHASWLSMWLSARATKALQMDSCSCWRFHCQLHCNLCFDFQWRATHASTTATNQLFDFRLLQLRCCKLEAKQWTVVTLPFHSIGASMRCIMRNSPWETAYHNTLF